MLLSVKGPNEGELVLECSPTELRGALRIEVSPKVEEHYAILYRLRVKEASLLFSKTYGTLGTSAPHNRSEDISLCAKAAVAESKSIATIRVEFVRIAKSAAPASADVQKSEVKPLFEKGGVLHYDIKCILKNSPQNTPKAPEGRIRYVAAAVSGLCVAALVALALKKRGALAEVLQRARRSS
ncbi:hypothetical protein STCU_03266 [Strigomonas culicis]|uniref:MSP domain-containing protein n=1 Tax=Strigomonas culicis TaxID=28005 RepID=S9U0D5_9TRYP|nr:hypothetical protein STCU_07298 [Strigomonas culicis]EPY31759.1 hypothetical protein STCU_03266 [Strigomonas culicis]|eukprot:EPY24202.1 hypothetical protein STCU_07298 [Strigomonas culicis]